MKIVVASENPIKIAAVTQAAKQVFSDYTLEITGYPVASKVRSTPLSDTETKQGALNRIEGLKLIMPNADLWVAIEAGCMEDMNAFNQPQMICASWVLVQDKNKNWGESRSVSIQIPDVVADLVRQGIGLNTANNQVFNVKNSKHTKGALGLWTDNMISRLDECVQPLIAALTPIKNSKYYYKL